MKRPLEGRDRSQGLSSALEQGRGKRAPEGQAQAVRALATALGRTPRKLKAEFSLASLSALHQLQGP